MAAPRCMLSRGHRYRSLAAGVAGLGILAVAFLWGGPSTGGFGGPFHGRTAAVPTATQARQRFPVFGKDVIEVYDNPSGSGSPVVVFRADGKRVLWSIYADGTRNDDVRSIHFDGFETGLFWNRVIRATVVWTCGEEQSLWHVDRIGRLSAYYFDF